VYEDIENVRDSVLQAEENIFAGNENRMVQALSNLSRELIDFRESVRIHMEVWNEMMIYTGNNLFGENFKPYIKDIHDEFNRIHELIQNSKELVGDLKSTNDSLLNTKQNNIIRTLTLINFIFIPATFIAALFTIPAVNVPLIDKAFGWHSLFALMLAITLTIWIIFKTRKWI